MQVRYFHFASNLSGSQLRKEINPLSVCCVVVAAAAAVVLLLFYVHGKHLRSCRDGRLT